VVQEKRRRGRRVRQRGSGESVFERFLPKAVTERLCACCRVTPQVEKMKGRLHKMGSVVARR